MTRPWLGASPAGRVLAALLLLATASCVLPRWPVDATVTSPWGIRFRGIVPGVHRGVDLGVPVGTPVRAMAPGYVRFAGVMEGYGSVIWLDHGGSTMSVYAHLSELRVSAGERVGGRQVIALSGMSGTASAPHLHFEIWRWGHQTDPVPLLGGRPGR